jgi:hypothetical protein
MVAHAVTPILGRDSPCAPPFRGLLSVRQTYLICRRSDWWKNTRENYPLVLEFGCFSLVPVELQRPTSNSSTPLSSPANKRSP